MKSIKVGLLGIGTVGSGTYAVLKRNQDLISGRAGRRIDIVMVAARNVARARTIINDSAIEVVADAMAVVNHPDIDVVVEVIGGCTLARELVLQAIAKGKHVVTANKALLAMHGAEIFAAAEKQGVMVAFEGAVAVSIPIIKALREGLAGNRIEWIAGIINGTTNFILSEMRDRGCSFDDALHEAQRLGYAEADPSFDIEGIDAAHKLAIMAAIAFGCHIQFDKIHVEGIRQLQGVDIAYAESMGYRIKLLGIAKRTSAGIEAHVHPTLIPAKRLLANVDGSMNGIMVKSDAAGVTMYYGAGAGSEQTASAVIADLVDIARVASADPTHRVPYLGFRSNAISATALLPITDISASYYLRLRVADQLGVLADVTAILAELGISIEAMMQKEPAADEQQTDIIIVTHHTKEQHIQTAVAAIEGLPTVTGKLVMLRMENLLD